LSLLNKIIESKLTLSFVEYTLPLTLQLFVDYSSEGPSFRKEISLELPPILCSRRGSDWEFELPEIIGARQ